MRHHHPVVKFIVFACLVSLALVGSRPIKASALASSATVFRQWAIATTVTAVSVRLEIGNESTLAYRGNTKSIQFVHDSSGGPDIYIGFNGTTAAAPTSGDTIMTLKSGERIAVDIVANRVSVVAASGTPNMRIQAIY